ncbi:conserved protein of unknown function [Tenacibaculum sp. 190130A14a]|uniref:Uncharacterized protein n=1 Tax=Tenacibaculum polynesiense TaxID=3137857 RepID=A0ABM9P756_9FLAO
MKTETNLIKDYLNELLAYDWNKFNDLDFLQQLTSYNLLINKFLKIIGKHGEISPILFKRITKPYESHFKNLVIKGKSLHHFPPSIENKNGTRLIKYEGSFILHRLKSVLKDLEYEKMKSNFKCNCKLALTYNKSPDYENMEKIGWINDHYYLPEIYKCTICDFKWSTFILDDSSGRTVWEQLDSQDLKNIIYDK